MPLCIIGVSVHDGQTMFTRIWFSKLSTAAVLAIPMVACLDAVYGIMPAADIMPLIDAMTTIDPRPRLRVVLLRVLVYERGSWRAMAWVTARSTIIDPRELVVITLSKASTFRSEVGERLVEMPAEWTQ